MEIDAEIFPNDALDIEKIGKLLDHRTKELLVLEMGGIIVGYLILNPQKYTGHLQRIGVAKEYQGKGYGKRLMDAATSRFREQGLQRSVLYVLRNNKVAVSLYGKFGFQVFQRSWQYKVMFDDLKDSSTLVVHQVVDKEDFDRVAETYGVPVERLIPMLTEGNVFVEFTKDSKPCGFCRFTPSFPGCFPFELLDIADFDALALIIKRMSLPEFDHFRCTFEQNEKLALELERRGFECVDDMFVMETTL